MVTMTRANSRVTCGSAKPGEAMICVTEVGGDVSEGGELVSGGE